MSYIHVRLYEDGDGDIIDWLAGQENKSQAVKDAIRAVIGGDVHQVDAPMVDLFAIRSVFETVLDERLAALALAPSGDGAQGEDQELAAKLDAMF